MPEEIHPDFIYTDEEVTRNPYAKCPKCKSDLIDQISSEDRCTVEWYHCAGCGCWYNEAGEIDQTSTKKPKGR